MNRLTAPVTFLYLVVRMLRISGRPGAFVHGGLCFAAVSALGLFFLWSEKTPTDVLALLVVPGTILLLQYLCLLDRLGWRSFLGLVALLLMGAGAILYAYRSAPVFQWLLDATNVVAGGVVGLIALMLLGYLGSLRHRAARAEAEAARLRALLQDQG